MTGIVIMDAMVRAEIATAANFESVLYLMVKRTMIVIGGNDA